MIATNAFSSRSVLVVEDEAVIAMDLCLTVEEWGGQPLGPASSVREAPNSLAATPECRAAIVDVNLPDGDIGPVLDRLEERGAAVIGSTGFTLPSRCSGSASAYHDIEKARALEEGDRGSSRAYGGPLK
jgi:CheY-like chemotaxis protein